MAYEKFPLRREDYGSDEAFLAALDEEIAVRTKNLALAATYNLKQCCGCDELLDFYFKKLQTEIENELDVDELDVPETYDISLTQVGRTGDVYILDGYHRKATFGVQFAVTPPTGANISRVTITYGVTEEDLVGISVLLNGTFYFNFDMPTSDVLITITYGGQLSGERWDMQWFRPECTTEDASTTKTFEMTWECGDDPRIDYFCPICTSSSTLMKLAWFDDQCTSVEKVITLEWETDSCYTVRTEYLVDWTADMCAAIEKTLALAWSEQGCASVPQTGGDIVWKTIWEQNVCAGEEKVITMAWEPDEYECTSEETDAKTFRIYPASISANDDGYITGPPVYGTISPDNAFDGEVIAEFYSSQSTKAVSLIFDGGQYGAETQIRVRLAPKGTVFVPFNAVFIWNSGVGAYELTSSWMVDVIQDLAGKTDYVDITIFENGFGGDEGVTVDSFNGTNIVLDTITALPAGYDTFPMTFTVVGGTDHGKSFLATGDVGNEGEYVELEVADTISQASVTDLTLFPSTGDL